MVKTNKQKNSQLSFYLNAMETLMVFTLHGDSFEMWGLADLGANAVRSKKKSDDKWYE